MLLPSTFEDLTPSWFSKILKGVHIKPETFKVIPNVQQGMGFLSMMVRVEFEADLPANDSESRRKYNLIVKLLPDENAFLADARDAVLEIKMDQVEINAYRFLLPDLISEIPEIGNHICQLHFAEIQEADLATKTPYTSVLILEDLRFLGYTTKLYSETLTAREQVQGIEFLASFHVASKALEIRNGITLPEMYKWFPDWLSNKEAIQSGKLPNVFSYFGAGFEVVYKFLEEQSRADLIQPYKALEPRATKILQAILTAAQKHPCGTHMDLWSHNLLVNSDPEKPVQVIDWQLVAYADPMLDFAIYLLTTLPVEEMNRSGICKALRAYFNTYNVLCAKKKIPLDRSYVELEKFFLTYGAGFGLCWFVMSCSAILNVTGGETKLMRALELLIKIGTADFLLSVT